MPSASTSTNSPRVKRPFQPSITSFFARSTDGYDDYQNPAFLDSGASHGIRSTTPSLPAPVQASLLNVGMRVRKSVPEGYKTHKQLSSINTNTSNVVASSYDMYSVKPPQDAVPEEYQHARELLPFCGLHKIGGFAEQPVTNTHLYGSSHTPNEDSIGGAAGNRPVPSQPPPLLFPLPAEAFNIPFVSSQDSTTSISSSISTDSAPARNPNPFNPNKRSWADETTSPKLTTNTNFLFASSRTEDEVPVSPLSSTPSQPNPLTNLNVNPAALRPFAQPRTRSMRRREGGLGMEGVEEQILKARAEGMEVDLENKERGSSEERMGDDFGEAEFLHPVWGSEEVEMGGV